MYVPLQSYESSPDLLHLNGCEVLELVSFDANFINHGVLRKKDWLGKSHIKNFMQLVDNTKLSDMSKSQRDAACVPRSLPAILNAAQDTSEICSEYELPGLGNRLVHSVVNALHKVESSVLLHSL